MSTYYFIKSKLDDNVIDIQNASTKSGALLDAYPQKTTGTDNQLWEFVPDPAGSGYYFIKSKLNGKVIDIQGASFNSKASLDAYPQKAAGTVQKSNNQLWQFLQDPAGSGYCFIMSKLNGNVIDIQKASTKSGTLLDSYPLKPTGTDNQLWTVVGGKFPSPVSAVPAPSSGLGSNSNYILYSNCNPLRNGFVIIDVTEDIVCQSASGSAKGFSFQLNCYSPKNRRCAFQQYIMRLNGNDLAYDVENWPVSGTNLFNLGTPILTSLPSSKIPAGYQLFIGWANDGWGSDTDGNVTGAFWKVVDNLGKTLADVSQRLTSISGVTSKDLAPIVAFELNLVGPVNKESAVLSSGAGTITYVVDEPILTVLNQRPSCTESSDITGETANSVYGVLPASPNGVFKQSFNISRT